MSTPGVSLFQGAESIKMNSSLERAEEEEELEDQRRRNEELGNLLQNAFDDLDDDDDNTTVDSSRHFPNNSFESNRDEIRAYHPIDESNRVKVNSEKLEAYESEIHHMKRLLESRTNELENIKKIANEEHSKRDELQKRLLIAEAELDRALASKKNTHELLVESKEKCSNLENTISKLRNEKKGLELENNSLLGKLETAQTMLSDVQRKYDMVERDLNRNNDRNADIKRKQMEDRHRAEIEVFQQQLEQLDEKLRKKTHELENMNTRYQALQNSHEVMLVDKGTKINELNHALNEAQQKCEELLRKEDYFQENVRLQKLVASLQDKIQYMEKTIATLNERLEQTTAEIDVMDTLLQQHNSEGTPSRLGHTQGKVIGSTPMNTVDRVGSLKEELYRALANVKSKRDEVKALQQTVEEKNIEIRHLKAEENKALVEISTLKEDKIRLENRIKILEEDLEEVRQEQHNNSKDQAKIQILNQEIKQLLTEKDVLHKQYQDTIKNLSKSEEQRKQLDAKLKNVQVDLEELKQEHESMKLNYEQIIKENQNLRNREAEDNMRLELEKHKFLLKDAQTEIDRLKNLYVEISNAKEALKYELEKLRSSDNLKEMQELRDKTASLQRALQLAELKCGELSKILESEKLSHERDMKALREKIEKEKMNQIKLAKENPNDCSKCLNYVSEITKYEIQNLKISNLNSVREKEIEELTRELEESRALIEEMTEKLKLGEQQEHLIRELKTKATQFEEYIKSQSASSVSDKSIMTSSSPKVNGSLTTSDKSVETSPELRKEEIKKIEARIRDEMAKIFATELKRFQIKLKDMEEKNLCLHREYQHVTADLQQRQTEVDLLKEAILAERDKMEEMFKEKDEEFESKLQKLNQVLLKCREEIQMKNKAVNDLRNELDERQRQIEAERKSMKAVMSQWENQRKNIEAVEAEWREKVEDLKKSYDSAMASWQTKYNSAKHTAKNYKRYAEDKEAHMLKEYERIRLEYDTNLTKLEARLHEELEKKDREMKEALAAIDKKRISAQENKENKMSN